MYSNCLAQFSPPGLGETNIASWLAIGIQQNLNKKETIKSATHFGTGRISNPDNYNPIYKQSIYVLNEEITNRFKENWSYSFAVSYRWQNRYKSYSPYELDLPKTRQELRFYGRFAYMDTIKKMNYSVSYRPELRFFYNPDLSSPTSSSQLRSRLRGKIDFNINSSKTHKIVTTAEFFFSTTKSNSWSKFEYQETRLCLYYSISFPKQKIELNLGYMNNILGKTSIQSANYLAFDVLIKNPFEK